MTLNGNLRLFVVLLLFIKVWFLFLCCFPIHVHFKQRLTARFTTFNINENNKQYYSQSIHQNTMVWRICFCFRYRLLYKYITTVSITHLVDIHILPIEVYFGMENLDFLLFTMRIFTHQHHSCFESFLGCGCMFISCCFKILSRILHFWLIEKREFECCQCHI